MIITPSYAPSNIFEKVRLHNRFLVIAASFLIAVFASVSIPLPFTPVPITLQSHVCLFLGVLLGSRRGALAVLAFLAQGALGLPVFAGGAGGIVHFFGPTGGYLIGYVVGTYVTGLLMERAKTRDVRTLFWSILAGSGFIFLFGVSWLSVFVNVKDAIALGFLPFIFGDLVKTTLAIKGLEVFSRRWRNRG